MGSEEKWQVAQKALAKALQVKNIPYREMQGEAVFYGPKIDVNIVDASGREWQCSTIQFDFNLPRRFNITYTGADGKEHDVLMIHRVLVGAIERFFAILLEHYKGNLPTWLAPIQARILPISDKQQAYAQTVHNTLQAYGVRSEIDSCASTLHSKIREAEIQKIPYMIICGKREAKLRRLSVRKHGVGNVGVLKIKEFADKIRSENT
jgi:threonyl-tRNA synthetase